MFDNAYIILSYPGVSFFKLRIQSHRWFDIKTTQELKKGNIFKL